MNARDGDVCVCKLVPEAFCKPAHGEFRRAIRTLFLRRDQTEHARDVNDVSAFLLKQRWKKSLCTIDHAPEVDAHQPFEILDGQLLERSEQTDTGIINKMSNAPVFCDHILSELRYGCTVRDIENVCRH